MHGSADTAALMTRLYAESEGPESVDDGIAIQLLVGASTDLLVL
jgi:hypothetical protein